MKKLLPSTFVLLALILGVGMPQAAYAQQETPNKGYEKKEPQDPNSFPKDLEQLKKSLDDLLKEAKNLGLNSSSEKPQSALEILKMATSPVEGTYQFFKNDAKEIPNLFKNFRNFQTLNSDQQAKTIIHAMRIVIHSMDTLATARLTTKVCVSFANNLKMFWKLGAGKAITASIAKTSAESAKDLKQYLAWSQYSYQSKNLLNYIEKNYGQIKHKLDRFLQEVEKVVKEKFPQFQPAPKANPEKPQLKNVYQDKKHLPKITL